MCNYSLTKLLPVCQKVWWFNLWRTEVVSNLYIYYTLLYGSSHLYYRWFSPLSNATCILSSPLCFLLPGLTSINQPSVQYNPFLPQSPAAPFAAHTLSPFYVLRCSGVSLHASTFTVIASQSITAYCVDMEAKILRHWMAWMNIITFLHRICSILYVSVIICFKVSLF